MSEQIQVREGVWRLRNGWERQIEPMGEGWKTRDIDGNKIAWWKDGRFSRDYGQHEWDLVEYVGPLPGTEPEPAPEPQPVQVCEGVWLTRDGEHVEVRARDMTGNESSEWQWLGRRKNLLATWRNDGTLNASREQSNGDLVQFLRPLPGTETTTEQLAEIEAGMAEIEKDVAELVQQDEACRLQGELLLVTAERDRLQQDLAAMTKHSAELLESAQQARDERDLLAQRLWVKPSEEALQKQVGRQQIEINTLKDRLGDMTTDRDTSARELFRVTADRDNLLQLRDRLQETLREQRQAIDAARAVQQQLETMTSERDELATELQAMTEHCRRQHEQIRALQAELDAAGQQPAPADKSEQIERIWDESRERAVSEIIELLIPLQVATGTHAESVLQILPAVIRRWMDGGGCDDAE